MKILKPVYDRDAYARPIAKLIFQQLDELIFGPLQRILKGEEVKLNALAQGKPTMYFQGIPIHIENPAGSYRKGKKWIQQMQNDYGYICKTRAIDGDELDCFVGLEKEANKFYVVEQLKENGNFDEYKVMFGFSSLVKAQEGYLSNYQLGWTGLGHIQEHPMDKLWDWYTESNRLELQNATETPLAKALRTGKIQYTDNTFLGPLTAAISKELRGIGARYNKTKRAYTLEISALPSYILGAIASGNVKNKETLRKVEDFLKAIQDRKVGSMKGKIEKQFGETLDSLSKQFHVTTKTITSADVEIPLQKQFADQLKEAYTENLDKYIQDWHDTQVLRLRQKVSKNVSAGFRAENLIETIQAEKQTSYKHAKFLAKQETSLMVSKYREIRYLDAGINKYVWSTSHDARVRQDHRELNGKVFRFDQPPVTNLHTMARNNPGEDFGCRCIARPVIPSMDMLVKEYANK